jgi:predicted P-loop ATPase
MKSRILMDLVDQSGSIVPIVEGKKSILGWDELRDNPASKDDISEWVTSGDYQGYGIIMNNEFHCIDFDQKNAPTDFTGSIYREVWKQIPEALKSKLTVQRTISGGEHIIYRCPIEAHSSTLAKNPDSKKKVIETIGSKGYVMLYDDVPSGSWSSVQTITKIEHEWLLNTTAEVGKRLFGDAEIEKSQIEVIPIPSNSKKPNQNDLRFLSSSAVQIEQSSIDITDDYETWVRIGYGIANDTGEVGREYFHKISEVNINYDFEETEGMYTSFLKGSRNHTKASLATLRHLIKKHKVPTSDGENKTAHKTKTAIEFINERGLQKNKFTNKVEQSNGELITDSDVNDVYLQLRLSGLAISKMDVASIINSSSIRKVNPLRDWIEESEKYADDHTIEDFLDCLILKDTDPEMQQFIKSMVVKWLLQIPAMILDITLPRLVLVAIGDTYIGKSELFRRLLPQKFGKYYAESGLDRDKDSEILMSEHLLVNVDELAGIMRSPKHVERFKSLSSSKYFTLRTPYGKINERFQRKSVLCGTSNKLDILMDHDTGNSRIIPLELANIDKDKYNAIDRNALFGSLAKMYKDVGAEYLYLTPEEREMLQKKSEDHTVINIEEELVLKYFKPTDKDDNKFKTVTEICDLLAQHTSQQFDPKKVSRELNKHGFIKDRKRVGKSKSALSGFYVESNLYSLDDMKNKFFGDA